MLSDHIVFDFIIGRNFNLIGTTRITTINNLFLNIFLKYIFPLEVNLSAKYLVLGINMNRNRLSTSSIEVK